MEYLVRVVHRHPTTGKQVETERRLKNVTLAQALAEQAKLRAQLKTRVTEGGAKAIQPRSQGRTGDETLTAFVQRWLVHVESSGRRRPHVVDKDVNTLDAHILPFLGHLTLREISVDVLMEWKAALVALRKPSGNPYARETLRGAWRLLKAILRDAVPMAGLASSPMRDLKCDIKGAPPKEKASATREEMHAILAAAEHERPDIRAMMWVGFSTGMRFGEITALRWQDVDFKNGEIHVRRSQVYGGVFPTKSGDHRRVPLHADVANVLREHREWCSRIDVLSPEVGLIFPSIRGTYRTSACLRRAIRRCAARAGVDQNVTPHSMRRTVNNLVRQGAGDIAARAIVGHVTEEMTEHYSKVTLDEKHRALLGAVGQNLAASVRARGMEVNFDSPALVLGSPAGDRAGEEANPSSGSETRNEKPLEDRGVLLVELDGIEPTTSSLQIRSASTRPRGPKG